MTCGHVVACGSKLITENGTVEFARPLGVEVFLCPRDPTDCRARVKEEEEKEEDVCVESDRRC